MDNNPLLIDQDSEMFLYQIKTTDDKIWLLKILGSGGERDQFEILKTHPEVFGWEEVQGMLKLVSGSPIDPKVLVEAIRTDPIDSISIVDNKTDQNDITKSFIDQYSE